MKSNKLEKMNLKNKKGFTLIELLVVISIISLLASIVMTTLSGARAKAKDAVVKQGLVEFAKLLEFEYNDTGSYQGLQSGVWVPGTSGFATCVDALSSTSTYLGQARNICTNIVLNAMKSSSGDAFLSWNNVSLDTTYSVMARLNNGNFFCVGKTGNSETAWYSGSPPPRGCPFNP